MLLSKRLTSESLPSARDWCVQERDVDDGATEKKSVDCTIICLLLKVHQEGNHL